MGCFGFICKGCNTPINGNSLRGGENCILIHVRHGKELGRTVGHYNEYGTTVEEDEKADKGVLNTFRCDEIKATEGYINTHEEICKSSFNLPDSFYHCVEDVRLYRGKPITFNKYNRIREMRRRKEIIKELMRQGLSESQAMLQSWDILGQEGDKTNKYINAFLRLDKVKPDRNKAYSGIAAWHVACWNKATKEERVDLTPSYTDPNQSWGEIRKEFE